MRGTGIVGIATLVVATLLATRLLMASRGKGPAIVLAAGLVVLLVVILLAVGVKMFDVSGRRETLAAALEATLLIALRRGLGPLPLRPVVSVPPSRRAPVTIEITGRVPTPALRDAVLRIAERELSGRRRPYRIVDRLRVAPVAPAA